MGNWLSCFHLTKSKSNTNVNTADNCDDGVDRLPVERGSHFERASESL